jgi:uncharacterized protein (DUF1330 family)
MAAYVIADIRVTDPEGYAEHRRLAPRTVAQYGGTFVVRGGRHEVVEGDRTPTRLVVLRFDTTEQAPAKAIRERTARARLVLVEGVD